MNGVSHQRLVFNCPTYAEYKFVVLERHINWFEALDECRRQGGDSELLSIQSLYEESWIHHVLESLNYSKKDHLVCERTLTSL